MASLEEYKEKYTRAFAAYEANRTNFETWKKQFDGDLSIPNGKPARTNYNFTRELMEAQIDSNLPQPSVQPRKPTERNRELSENITAMLRNELDRLPFETLNDLDERIARIMGGSAYLTEWDNAQTTHNTVGALDVRLLSPLDVIPQEKIYDIRKMDYLFLTFEDTKTRLKKRYGKDLVQESIDPQTAEQGSDDERVTQVICFYRAQKAIGCISWAGDTELINDNNYFARKDKICSACGKAQPRGESVCICGSNRWETRPRDYETRTEDVIRSDGSIIPAMSPVRMEDGSFAMEEVEQQATDPQTGLPLFDYIFDAMGQPIGEQPRTTMEQRVVMQPTQIPYYLPKDFPLAVRKNISAYRCFLGGSDCEAIREHQLQANKAMSKIDRKIVATSEFFTKPADLDFKMSNEQVNVLNVENPGQLAMIKAVALDFDMQAEYMVIDKAYNYARSILGITDSFQGKPDPTAQSGRAKEAQIAQAAGVQLSKRVMKNAAYSELFETMFKFLLAYADEPRTYTTMDDSGQQVERTFNRFDFLEQDEYGNWFYNDAFLFSVDEAGAMKNDKQFLLEDVRTDFGLGAFGNPAEPQTMLMYWKEKEVLGYPNAKRMVKHWQEKTEEMQQMQQQQQAMQQQMMQMQQMPQMQFQEGEVMP